MDNWQDQIRLIKKLTADKMETIKPYFGRQIQCFDGKWILHSCNDHGYLYWHKKGQKKLYTIANYRDVDLPTIKFI